MAVPSSKTTPNPPQPRNPDEERSERPLEALKNKFKSRRGASILMALMMLLLSMLVGASVLMAAASNAGKLRGVQEEQQKYLTLSSALNLLVDELERVEYVGKYEYTWNEDDHIHTYRQDESRLWLRGTDTPWELNEVLPLYSYFDGVFAVESGEFDEGEYTDPITGDKYFYATDIPSASLPHYTLELELNDASDTYGGLSDKVSIDVELREDGSIYLTATLEETDYKMIALLSTDLDIHEYPKDRLVLQGNEDEDKTYETKPIRWNLEYVLKKEA